MKKGKIQDREMGKAKMGIVINHSENIFLPQMIITKPEMEEKVEAFVKNGGTVIVTYRHAVKDADNNEISLKELANSKKNTVFYFWTASQKKHFRNVNQHITELEKKYPRYNFVGINLRTSYPQWKMLMDEYHLDKNKQFYGENFKEIQMAMIIDGLNKCVIAKDTVVIDGFADLFKSL